MDRKITAAVIAACMVSSSLAGLTAFAADSDASADLSVTETDSGYSVTSTLANIGDSVVIIAAYDSADALVALDVKSSSEIDDGKDTAQFAKDKNIASFKLMVWDSFVSMKPIIDEKEYSLNSTVALTDKITVSGADYYYAKADGDASFTLDGAAVTAQEIGETGCYYYSKNPLSGTLYGTANLPYADFYYGELNELSDNASTTPDVTATEDSTLSGYREDGYYDAVSCATTSKSTRWSASYYETDTEAGTATIYGIKDVPVAVSAELYAEASVLNAAGVTDANTNGILAQTKAITLTDTVPTVYKTLRADGTYSALNATAETVDGTGATIDASVTWGDYEITLPTTVADFAAAANLVGIVLTTDDGAKYAMRHSQNTWLKTYMFAWSIGVKTTEPHGNTLEYKSFEDMEGKTITNVRYIMNDEGVFSEKDIAVDLKVKNLLAKAGTDLGITAESVLADTTNGSTVTFVKNVPEDSAYALESVTYGGAAVTYAEDVDSITIPAESSAVGAYSATFTDEKYEDISVSFDLLSSLTQDEITLTDGQLVISSDKATAADYAAAITSVTVASEGAETATYSASGRKAVKIFDADGKIDATVQSGGANIFESGTTYTLTVKASGYEDFTFTYTPTAE